jgi:hypothetical protein
MSDKQMTTHCVVRLVALCGLSAGTRAQCPALRAEAGRLWTDLAPLQCRSSAAPVPLHAQARAQAQWLRASDLEQATKGGQYALHSQSVQALCQKLSANVVTATELRRQEGAESGHVPTQYPHHPQVDQTVVWKDQALVVLSSGSLRLPCRRPCCRPCCRPCRRRCRRPCRRRCQPSIARPTCVGPS